MRLIDADALKLYPEWKQGVVYQEHIKPVTSNADRIRAMSNEEIAAIICAGCPPGEKCYVCTTGGCGDCWFDWLQSPVGGDVNG